MRPAGWACVEAAAGLLDPHDREIVLGDLSELECSFWHSLNDVLGLVMRRQAAHWTSWKPWAASIGAAWPASLFLMGNSVAVSGAFLHHGFTPKALADLSLLIVWAWITGFAAAALSRKTLWATALAAILPCAFCLSLWPGSSISALRLFLFAAPALHGAWRGYMRQGRLQSIPRLATTAILFLPFLWTQGGGLYGLAILWPAIYLAFISQRQEAPA